MDGFLRFEPAFCCGDDLVRYHDLFSNKLWFQGVIRRGSETSDVWTERGCSRITVTRAFVLTALVRPPLLRGRFRRAHQGNDVRNLPKPIGHAGRHGRRHPKRLVDADEVVIGREQRDGMDVVFDLLGKPVRQPGEPAEKLRRCPGSNGFADRVRRASDPCPPANIPDRRTAAPSFDGNGLRGRVGGLRRGHLTAAAPDRGRECDLGPRPDAIPAVPQREDGADPP